MYRDRPFSIVAGRVVLVLRLVGFRLHRSDQLGLGLANLELLEPCRELNDRHSASSCRRETESRIRRNCRWNEDWTTPPGRLKKPVKPTRGNRAWIERNQPRQRADLSPDVPNLASYRFGHDEVF